MQKSLPIGVESFRELRESDYYYVDKTALILRLIDGCKYYFFARPRGFGTSVLLDTIQCLYEGRRELFTGLYAKQHWDWSKTNPVLRFRFGDRPFATPEDLESSLAEQLAAFEQVFDIPSSDSDAPDRLRSLLRKRKFAESTWVTAGKAMRFTVRLICCNSSTPARSGRLGLKPACPLLFLSF